MIRGTLSLLAVGAGFLHAAIGDWQAWTYTQSPVMAAVSGTSIWMATSGGAVQYDTVVGKSMVRTNLDGLSSTNLVGIVAQGDTLWTTSAEGDLNRLLPNARTWEALGSYRQSGWTFNPRVLAAYNSQLFLGGPNGLSVFSTTDKIALDNISSFGDLMNQKVHAVLVEKDTIWVGLQDGAAYAVPTNWKEIGRGRNILSDPSRWTVFRRTTAPVKGLFRWSKNDRMRTVPDTIATVYDTTKVQKYDTLATNLDTTYTYDTTNSGTDSATIDSIPLIDTTYDLDSTLVYLLPLKINTKKDLEFKEWNWATSNGGSPIICTGWDLYWQDKSWPVGGSPVHAVPYAGGLAVSVSNKGLVLLHKDGSLKIPTHPPQLPAPTPHHVSLRPDGSLLAWIGANVHTLPDARAGWSSDILTPGSPNLSLYLPTVDFDLDGNKLFAIWGDGLKKFTSTGSIKYDHLNSCFQPVYGPATGNFVAVSSIAPATNKGNWIGLYAGYDDPRSQFAFLPLNGEPKCYYVKIPSVGENFPNSLASEGDSILWVSNSSGINRLRIVGDSLVASGTSLPNLANATWMRWHEDRLFVISDFQIYSVVRKDGIFRKYAPTSSLLQSRGYRQVEIDTLGNLWISSSKGLDVISMSDDSTFKLEQRLDHSTGLLSDDITHFSLNRANGSVAIATPFGVNLYQSRFKIQPENLEREQVRPFPNPFRKFRHSKVAFPGVNSSAELFIFGADGTLINHQSGKDVVGDQFLWTPRSNLRPGLYFWTISDGSSRVQGRLVVGD